MAIEIIPKSKPERKQISVLDIFYYFAISLPFLLLFAYFGIILFQNRAQTRLAEIDVLIAEKETREAKILEKEILEQKKKIDVFSDILWSYKKSSPLFELLKNICHKEVSFVNAEITPGINQATLLAQTSDFKTLREQILLFENEPLIKNTELVSGSVAERGGVNFSVILTFDSEFFKGFHINNNF